ncbi:MAG: helix-hairpin-helix domain-containing protein [Oscillospiraceae bacterium]|nr:helix-hairpin-helix domain-containing protein [Oscillospiraceae bacterium]
MPAAQVTSPPEITEVSSSGTKNGRLININTADTRELIKLSGIGEVKAAAIVAYREEHGAFSSLEELLNVKGIGEKTLEKIRGYITV